MTTPQRSMILDSPAQHLEETCRRARQVSSRYGTAPEASVDDHGAMASHGHTFDDLLRVQPSPMLLYTVSPSQLPDWLLFCVTPVTFSR